MVRTPGLFRALPQSCNYCSTTTQRCERAHPENVLSFPPPPIVLQPLTSLVVVPLKRHFCFQASSLGPKFAFVLHTCLHFVGIFGNG